MHSTRITVAIGSIGTLLVPTFAFAADATTTNGASSRATTTIQASEGTDFLNTFLQSSGGDNGTGASNRSGTAFDIRAFRAHPCFEAVGEERDYCLELFGVTTDFSDMIEQNMLGTLIIGHALRKRCEGYSGTMLDTCTRQNAALLPQLMAQLNPISGTGSLGATQDDNDVASDEDAEDAEESIPLRRYQRSQELWELCRDHEQTQSGCYQTHIRFVTDDTHSLVELEEVLGMRSSDDTDDDSASDDTPRVRSSSRTNRNNSTADDATSPAVHSAEDEDMPSRTMPTTQREREEWLWELCASSLNQPMCYRSHFRTAINEDTDLQQLEEDLRG